MCEGSGGRIAPVGGWEAYSTTNSCDADDDILLTETARQRAPARDNRHAAPVTEPNMRPCDNMVCACVRRRRRCSGNPRPVKAPDRRAVWAATCCLTRNLPCTKTLLQLHPVLDGRLWLLHSWLCGRARKVNLPPRIPEAGPRGATSGVRWQAQYPCSVAHSQLAWLGPSAA